ncbi:hypothetical protein QF006_001444 [Pantoea agglomerans]|nr:hypothetical protein [Pantoea agglomerans]
MTISLHTQASAPNTAAVTSVSPLDPSGCPKTKFSKTKTDIYQTVTDSIIAALETGVKPWACPWQRTPVCLVCRPITQLAWHTVE